MRTALLAGVMLSAGAVGSCTAGDAPPASARPGAVAPMPGPTERAPAVVPEAPGGVAAPAPAEESNGPIEWFAALKESIARRLAGGAPARSPGATASGWYDAKPLLANLREEEAQQLLPLLGMERLEDLTLYDMDIHLDLNAATFRVEETIWYTNRTGVPLVALPMRVFVNDVGPRTGPQVSLRYGRCLGVECDVQWDGQSLVVAVLDEPVPPGGRLRVQLGLNGEFQRLDPSRMDFMAQGMESLGSMAHGAKHGDYGLVSVSEGTASLASFFAVVARIRDGEWIQRNRSTMGDLGTDELANYRARVHTAPSVRVFPVGVAVPTSTAGRTDVVAAAVRDFTVLASSSLQTASARVGDVVVRSHFLPAHERAGLRVLRSAADSLNVFQARFGRYPYRDLDVVEAPLIGGAGGVEFSGLVTVATMFYRDPSGGKMRGMFDLSMNGVQGANPFSGMIDRMLDFVTAHEVAHQFWHGLVGSDSRAHPFADEGLAQFSSVLYLEDARGQERAEADADMQVAMNYRSMRMMGKPDGPVDRAVADFPSPMEYAGLVYGKGPLMYRHLRRALGDEVFFGTLRRYVERYRFRMAPRRGFIDMLEEQRGATVRPIVRRWLDEAHGDEDIGGDWQVPGMPGAKASEIKQMMDMLRGLSDGTGQMPEGMPPDVQQLLEALTEPPVQ